MQAKITAHPRFTRARIDDRLYSAFSSNSAAPSTAASTKPGAKS